MSYIVIAKSTDGQIKQIDRTFSTTEEAQNYMANFTDVADYNVKFQKDSRHLKLNVNPENMKKRASLVSRWF